MARAKYTITDDDEFYAKNWIFNKLDSGFFPYDFEDISNSISANIKAKNNYRDNATKSVESLNHWCETHLNSAQWKQLKNAVRAARLRRERQRNYDKAVRRIDISNRARHMLQELSKHHGVTYSELIEKYLEKDYMNLD